MSSVSNSVEAIKRQSAIDEQLENIFIEYFGINDEANKDNAGYKAWAYAGVVTAKSIANVFLAVSKPESGRGFRAITDLAYELHANDFWAKNSGFLMPLIVTSLNAHKDYAALLLEKEDAKEYAQYDKVLCGLQTAPLEVFSGILYLVGGPALMAVASAPLRLALAPYFSV